MYAAPRGERGAAIAIVEWFANYTEQHVGARSPPYTQRLLRVALPSHTSNLSCLSLEWSWRVQFALNCNNHFQIFLGLRSKAEAFSGDKLDAVSL